MPQYAILADHSPEICPTSNSKSRVRADSGLGTGHAQALRRGGHHLRHRTAPPRPGTPLISVVDAPSIEAVTQLVHATGMSQWNTVEVCPVLPLADMMADLDAFPIVFG